ncbi:MAG: SH3 domain-containing protein, partial [Spirochaetales bacterium]|nr:SH3 domain-containing protein [Spirochaetales bacterium]
STFNQDISSWSTIRVRKKGDFWVSSGLAEEHIPPFFPDNDKTAISEGEKEMLFVNLFLDDGLFTQWGGIQGYDFIRDHFLKALGWPLYGREMLQEENHYDFEEIDPYFLEWWRQKFPLPNPEEELTFLSPMTYQELYDEAREDLRSLGRSYVLIKLEESAFKGAALRYALNPGDDHLLEDCYSISVNIPVNVEAFPPAGAYDSGELKTLWLRRMIDGSINSGWFLLYDIFSLYDSEWLAELEKAAPSAFEDTPYASGVSLQDVTLLSEPESGARNLGLVPRGASLTVVARTNDAAVYEGQSGFWYLVDSGELRGWCFGPQIDLTDRTPEELTPYIYRLERSNLYESSVRMFENSFVINADQVNIRKGPGQDSPVLTQLNRGDEIIPLEKDREESIGEWKDHWYKIRLLNEEIGYVYGPFISFKIKNRITDGEDVKFGTDDIPAYPSTILYEFSQGNLKAFSCETRFFSSENLKAFLEQNEAFPKLYEEVKEGIDLSSGLSLYTGDGRWGKGFWVIEMDTKTIVLYDLDYFKIVDLEEGGKFEVTGYSAEGGYAVSPDGTYKELSSKVSDFYSDKVDPGNEMESFYCSRIDLDLVTDLDGDDNPELWYSDVGYETSDYFISFVTEDSIERSGYLFDWSTY